MLACLAAPSPPSDRVGLRSRRGREYSFRVGVLALLDHESFCRWLLWQRLRHFGVRKRVTDLAHDMKFVGEILIYVPERFSDHDLGVEVAQRSPILEQIVHELGVSSTNFRN